MEKRLQSLLKNRIAWWSLIKTAIFGAVILIAEYSGFSFWSILLFFTALFALYFSGTEERRLFRSGFWFLALFALPGTYFAFSEAPFPFQFIFFIALLSIFFFIQGNINFLFSEKKLIYDLSYIGISFLSISVLSALGESEKIWMLMIFLFVSLIFGEWMRFYGVELRRSVAFLGFGMGLVSVEIFTLLGFFPLGIVPASILLSALIFSAKNISVAYFSGDCNKNLVLREAGILISIVLLVFMVSPWSI